MKGDMARTRLLKPDFFTDPDLSEVSIWARVLFSGLWCHADKAGRLKYEPKKLKVMIFPYDSINIEKLIAELSIKPFIQIYSENNVNYLQVINWDKHQNPHHTEKDSIIPPPNDSLTVKEPLDNGVLTPSTYKVKVSDKVKAYTEFTPPTVDEVKDYLLEKNITSIDPIKFVAHYESTGWVRGKNKIKNWKACVYTWLK